MHDDRVNWRDSTRLIRHLHTFERSITQPDCFITCAYEKEERKSEFSFTLTQYVEYCKYHATSLGED
ncbi:MAG: hypothetical protein ACI90V_006330 [Bacillariaceae sp.]|jgi:hypothetical protein